MFSHLSVGASNLERAFSFYAPIMEVLGLALSFKDEGNFSWAGWKPADGDRPLFIITSPYDEREMSAGNGQMTAFLSASRQIVDKVYSMAIEMGAKPEGEPGLRPHYHPNYYGAYFRDLDGNKIAICCHKSSDPYPKAFAEQEGT